VFARAPLCASSRLAQTRYLVRGSAHAHAHVVVLCPRALPCLFVHNVPTYVSICMCYSGLKSVLKTVVCLDIASVSSLETLH
jgi:hypothetical protein